MKEILPGSPQYGDLDGGHSPPPAPPVETDAPVETDTGEAPLETDGLAGDNVGDDRMDSDEVPGNPRDEKEKLKPLCDFEVQAGAMYYLVEMSWWNQWKEWVAYGDDSPDAVGTGPRPPQKMDNAVLFKNGSTTKLHIRIQEGQDFVFVTAAAWELIVGWYPDSGPAVPRRGINPSAHSRVGGSRAVVELHGVSIEIFLSTQLKQDPLPKVPMVVSKASSVRELKETIVKHYAPQLDGKEIRIWDYFKDNPFALLDTPNKLWGSTTSWRTTPFWWSSRTTTASSLVKASGGVSSYEHLRRRRVRASTTA